MILSILVNIMKWEWRIFLVELSLRSMNIISIKPIHAFSLCFISMFILIEDDQRFKCGGMMWGNKGTYLMLNLGILALVKNKYIYFINHIWDNMNISSLSMFYCLITGIRRKFWEFGECSCLQHVKRSENDILYRYIRYMNETGGK